LRGDEKSLRQESEEKETAVVGVGGGSEEDEGLCTGEMIGLVGKGTYGKVLKGGGFWGKNLNPVQHCETGVGLHEFRLKEDPEVRRGVGKRGTIPENKKTCFN